MWIAKEKYGYETYVVANEMASPIAAEIVVNPKEGRLFEIDIRREHHDQEIDDEVGVYYVYNPEHLESNEAPIITVEGVREVLGRHGIELPSDLAERLGAHEKAHLEAMREARLEYEFEAQRMSEIEHRSPEDWARVLDGESGFVAVDNSYFVKSTSPAGWASVTVADGEFEVSVVREDQRDHWDGSTGEYTQAPEDEVLHQSRETTVEDVQKAVEPFGIELPESLNKELAARQNDQREITDQFRAEWIKKFGRDPEEHFAEERARERGGKVTPEPMGYSQEEYERQADWAAEQSGNRMSGLPEEPWANYSRGRR